MEHNVVLLLLGLALVLTTSSSLLATSGSGRGDNGGNQPLGKCLEPGEISGSISLTSNGELWITIYVDTYSILASIDVVQGERDSYEYKFSIQGIAEFVESSKSSTTQLCSEAHQGILFNSPEQASKLLVKLMSELGIELTPESIRSVPFAVESGWRSPEKCKQFIKKHMDEHEES